jgi:hypothetical protein
MNRWHILIPNWVIITLFCAVLLLNFTASYEGFAMISKITKVVVVPLIIIYFFSKRNYMANIFFTIFLLMFFGDVFSVFNVNEFVSKLSKTAYLGSYLLLVLVVIGKLRRVKFEGLISWYLILIFALNTYFMYVLFKIVQNNFTDSVNMVLYISRGITILIMGFMAFAVYLSKENAQSILFLSMAFCFIFSDVLFYISDLYVFYWLFEFFERILHIVGLFLLYVYVFNHHEIKEETLEVESNSKHITT